MTSASSSIISTSASTIKENKKKNTATTPASASSSSSSLISQRPPPSQPNTACAACKYQRRKCVPDCLLAPFFPADQQRQFLNAHRLFGVSNIMKIIKEIDPVQRRDATNTIIFQSNMRAQDPIGGCYRYIRELERQIELVSAELAYVLQQLDFYRAQAAAQPLNVNANLILTTADDDHIHSAIYNSSLNQQQQYYSYNIYDGMNMNNNDSDSINDGVNDINAYSAGEEVKVDDSINYGVNDINTYSAGEEVLKVPPLLASHLQLQQERYCDLRLDEEDQKPAMEMLDLKPPFVVGDNAEDLNKSCNIYTSLNRSPGVDDVEDEREGLEDVQQHDLKGAASLFSLTHYGSNSDV